MAGASPPLGGTPVGGVPHLYTHAPQASMPRNLNTLAGSAGRMVMCGVLVPAMASATVVRVADIRTFVLVLSASGVRQERSRRVLAWATVRRAGQGDTPVTDIHVQAAALANMHLVAIVILAVQADTVGRGVMVIATPVQQANIRITAVRLDAKVVRTPMWQVEAPQGAMHVVQAVTELAQHRVTRVLRVSMLPEARMPHAQGAMVLLTALRAPRVPPSAPLVRPAMVVAHVGTVPLVSIHLREALVVLVLRGNINLTRVALVALAALPASTPVVARHSAPIVLQASTTRTADTHAATHVLLEPLLAAVALLAGIVRQASIQVLAPSAITAHQAVILVLDLRDAQDVL